MKVLILVACKSCHGFLVSLHTRTLRREIRQLIARRKNSMAIAAALSRGRIEKELMRHEVCDVKVDLLLSESRTSWDLLNDAGRNVKSINFD